jgi:enamine deaminase RidA (YjgF/YER057c/UK114 family)
MYIMATDCHIVIHKKGLENMTRLTCYLAVLLLPATPLSAQTLEYIGKPVRGLPISQGVKVGKFVFVSGTPAFDGSGVLAVGDFPAQMKQVMDNMTATPRGIVESRT